MPGNPMPAGPVALDLFCGVGEESLEPPRTAGIEASTPWRPVARCKPPVRVQYM